MRAPSLLGGLKLEAEMQHAHDIYAKHTDCRRINQAWWLSACPLSFYPASLHAACSMQQSKFEGDTTVSWDPNSLLAHCDPAHHWPFPNIPATPDQEALSVVLPTNCFFCALRS